MASRCHLLAWRAVLRFLGQELLFRCDLSQKPVRGNGACLMNVFSGFLMKNGFFQGDVQRGIRIIEEIKRMNDPWLSGYSPLAGLTVPDIKLALNR